MELELETSSTYELDLHKIYLSLSTSNSIEFDISTIFEKVNQIMFSESFKDNFRLIDNKKLIDNPQLFFHGFNILVKNMVEKFNIRNIGYIFLGYCDYFSIEYNVGFNLLPDNAKRSIESCTSKLIGQKQFNRIKAKLNDGVVTRSFFDL